MVQLFPVQPLVQLHLPREQFPPLLPTLGRVAKLIINECTVIDNSFFKKICIATLMYVGVVQNYAG